MQLRRLLRWAQGFYCMRNSLCLSNFRRFSTKSPLWISYSALNIFTWSGLKDAWMTLDFTVCSSKSVWVIREPECEHLSVLRSEPVVSSSWDFVRRSLGCRCLEKEREDRWLRSRYKGPTTFCTPFYRFVCWSLFEHWLNADVFTCFCGGEKPPLALLVRNEWIYAPCASSEDNQTCSGGKIILNNYNKINKKYQDKRSLHV